MQEFGESDLTIIFQLLLQDYGILRLRQENWTKILSNSWEVLKVRFGYSDMTRILPRLPYVSDKSLVMPPGHGDPSCQDYHKVLTSQ